MFGTRFGKGTGIVCSSLVCALLWTVTIAGQATGAPHRADPPQVNWNNAFAYWLTIPDATPPGMNKPDCTPSRQHPRPIVLINGTLESAYVNWAYLSPRLAARGYCVYGTNYGRGTGTQPPLLQIGSLKASAAEIGRFIDGVRRKTGSDTVDLVGHSEGGLVPLYYINHLGGDRKVHDMIGIAPITSGVRLYGALTALRSNPALAQQIGDALPIVRDGTVGSDFVRATARGGMTRPGVRYLTISSRHDLVVETQESALPAGPSVTNVVIQDYCPADHADHNTVVYDENVASVIEDRIAGLPLSAPRCRPVAPFVHIASFER